MTNQPGSPGNDMPPGAALLGREWLGLDEAGNVGTIRFLAQPSFTNRHGTIQGGFLAAMLDSATGVRALAALPPEKTAVTMSLDTRFLKPARPGVLTARARVSEHSEREIVVTADLSDEAGVIVASAAARLRILDKK
jgi:uncharacterized protein (TIGR00369 family)